MTRSREPEEKEFKGFNGTIYVVATLIVAITGLITVLAQTGLFSKLSSKQISIEPENITLKTPEAPQINSDSTPQLEQKNILPKRANLNTVKVGDLTATLQGCQRFDKELLCSVLLTDTKESSQLIVFNNHQSFNDNRYPLQRIRVLDFYGNEYTSEKVKVGNLEGENFVKSQTIEDVGIRIIASFPEFPLETQKLAAIEIPLKLSHNEYTNTDVIYIHLRDILISQ